MNLLEHKISDIERLCRIYKVSKLFMFGSILKDSFNDQSDIDLIVDFDQVSMEEYADNYFNLKDALEVLLERSVDLLEAKAIKNPYFKIEVDQQKRLIYG